MSLGTPVDAVNYSLPHFSPQNRESALCASCWPQQFPKSTFSEMEAASHLRNSIGNELVNYIHSLRLVGSHPEFHMQCGCLWKLTYEVKKKIGKLLYCSISNTHNKTWLWSEFNWGPTFSAWYSSVSFAVSTEITPGCQHTCYANFP